MSAQRTKKRFGSHRKAANQNEAPKTDENQATGNSESSCVQSNADNMPSPELKANRRKLGSRRRNKGQHEKDSATELSDKPKEEVENPQVDEALETQPAAQSDRQEELRESHEHDMSAASDDSLYSAVMSAYRGVQNYTINCPEDVCESQQVDEECDFVDAVHEGADESDSIWNELVKDNAALIGSSERVLSSQLGASCATGIDEKNKDADLRQQEGNLKCEESQEEIGTDKLERSITDPATVSSTSSSSKDEQTEPFSHTEEHDDYSHVNATANRRKLGSSRRNKRPHRVEDSVARPYHEAKEEVGDLETSNMSSLETAVQVQPVDMTQEMDKPDNYQTEPLKEITHGISDVYNPSLQTPPTLNQRLNKQPTVSMSSDENSDLFRHWRVSEAGDLVESTTTVKSNSGQDTEYEQSVEQTAYSPSKHEISTYKEDEQFSVSEVGRAQDVDKDVKKTHKDDVKPTATQDIDVVDYSSESVIHDGTENSEICSINPTEVGDSYQSESSVKSNGDRATKQGLLNQDEKQDERLTQDSNVEALDHISEDSHVYDPKNVQTSDTEGADTAVEGWLEDEVSNDEFQPNEMQENHVTDYSTESVIHDGTENSEIGFVNLIDQTQISDSHQSESSEKCNASCAKKEEVSNPEEEQDMLINVETLDQINEDFNVCDLQKTQTSDIEGEEPAEDDMKSTVEQSTEEEEGLLSELMEIKTLQSETHSPLESQPQDNSVMMDKQDNTEKSEEPGYVRVNEAEQNVSSSGAESEMSIMMETAVQEMSVEITLEGNDRFDPVHTEGVSDQAEANAQASTSEVTSSNSEKIPQELSSVCSVTDTESKEGDEDNDLLRQWENLEFNSLVNETHFKSEDVESSVTPDVTTEERNHEEPTEPECRVEQETDETSAKDEQTEQYTGALDSKDAVTKEHKEEVKQTEMHQVDSSSDQASEYSQSLQSEMEPDSSQNIKEESHTGFKPAGNRRKLGSSRRHKERRHDPDSVTESVIHDGTENSEIGFVNLIDQTQVSDSHQSESSEKSNVSCAKKEEVSNPEEEQDMLINVVTLDQINEDFNVCDRQKTQTSDIEGEEPAEDDMKSTVEQSTEEEEGLLSELMEIKTLQSETHSPLESQPQDNSVMMDKQDNTENSEEPGYVCVNEAEQNVSSSGAESEMSIMMETAVQEMSVEITLEGNDRFDPVHTEGVSDQAEENAQASTSEVTSSNSEKTPQELSSVCSVTDTESKEGDEDNDLLRQWENLEFNSLVNETHFKSEDVESSVTPDVTTEERNHEEPTEPECRVEQETDETSAKDEQTEQYSGALDSKDAVTKEHKEEVKQTEMHQVDSSSDQTSEYSQSLQSEMEPDSSQNIKEEIHTGFKPAGNRRKLGSSRRHKERRHVPDSVTEPYSDFKEEGVKTMEGDAVSEKEKMPSATETTRRDKLKEQIDLDFNSTETVRENRWTLKENAEHMTQEDATLRSQNSVESRGTVSTEGEGVSEVEEKVITEPNHLSPPTGYDRVKADVRESAEASDLKRCDDTDSNRSDTRDVLDQNEAKETAEAAPIQEAVDNSEDSRGPDQVEARVECEDNALNENVTRALVDAGHEENSRKERDISGTPTTKPPVHGNVQGARRKMGSTRRSQLNRKQLYDKDDTLVNNLQVQSGERSDDSAERVEELSSISTKDASESGNAQSPLSDACEEQQKIDENKPVRDETQEQQSCTLDLEATESNVIPGADDSTDLRPEQSAASHTEEAVRPVRSVLGAGEKDNKAEESIELTRGSKVTETAAVALADMEKVKELKEGAQATHFESMNANFSPANRRRKMGSTRRNLGSRSKEKDLHQEQQEDNEVTALIHVVAKEPQLHDENNAHSDSKEQRKEQVVETVEFSRTSESHAKPPALEKIEENPAGTEHRLTPKPRDVPSESAAGGRRRKMGSHRKSHTRQSATEKIVGEDEREGNESHEHREESSGLDRSSEVDKSDEKPPSNISVSRAAEHSQKLSETTPKRVTPVPRPDAGIRPNQEIQNKFSSDVAASEAGVRSRVFNVLLVGDSSVGKTSFLKRAQSGKFSLDWPASVGVDSYRWTVVVDGKPVVLQLWDTAGQERFRSITRQVFHRAQAFLLMYDITSSESFSAVSYWANCIQEGAAENVTILLIGNKSDRAERRIKTEEGETLSKEYNIDFMECSAATGENVVQTLETVARMLKQKADTRDESMVLHKEPPHKKRSGCC